MPSLHSLQDGEIVLASDVALAELVDLAANRLGLQVEYDRSILQGRIEFRMGEAISADRLWALTQSVLASRALTTVADAESGVLSVVPMRSAKARAEFELMDGRVVAPGLADFRCIVVRTQSISPTRAVTALRELSSPEGEINRVGETRLLVIADRRQRVQVMLRVLSSIDGVDAEIVSHPISLEHRHGDVIAAGLAELNSKRVEAGDEARKGGAVAADDGRSVMIICPQGVLKEWVEDVRLLDTPPSVHTRVYSSSAFPIDELAQSIEAIGRIPAEFGVEGSGERWRVVPDGLTGTLVVTASDAEHLQISAWMDRLSSPTTPPPRKTVAVPVEFRSARDIAELVSGLMTDRVEPPPASDDLVEGATQASTDVPNRPGWAQSAISPLVVVVDEPTNSLIVTGVPSQIDGFRSLIKAVDVRQSQVMLDLILVSLNEGDTRDLGVELQALVTNSGTLVRLASLFGLTSITPDDPSTSVQASGGTAVVLDPGDFSAVVRALETVSRGRSLIRPKLLVANNEEASLDAVEQQPFISTNASDTVATTSFGGTQDAGTTVSIQPQITSGEQLSIRYSVSLSTFVGESADPALPPARQQNSVSSVATIPDGYAIAIGGIANDTEGEAISKVPILGDIPLLGELFKSRSASRSSSRFYVLIQASILRDQGFEDLKYLSDVISDEVALDPSLPPLEPRVIR